MTIWFSSDSHFKHANVIKYNNRPFKYVEEMNETLVNNWNSVVKPEDTIYYLGDFSLGFQAVEQFSFRLNGRRYLVPGNHDCLHSYNKLQKKAEKRGEPDYWKQKYKDHGWILLPEQSKLDILGVGEVVLCHHPYPTFEGDKYANWRPKNEGKYLLHGHTHSKEKIKNNMIHVGVDAWNYFPISSNQIMELINASD